MDKLQAQVRIQAFVAHATIERLHKGAVGQLPGASEVQRDAGLLRQRSKQNNHVGQANGDAEDHEAAGEPNQ